MKMLALGLIVLMSLSATALASALLFGGPKRPVPLANVADPFKSVDFSQVPEAHRFKARDGAQLAYRRYGPSSSVRGSVVLVHGSSARSISMHPLAQSLAQAGYQVYAFDMRGHGLSGPHGVVGYIGQLEDDVEDFVKAIQPTGPRTLIGFSAGGGFALRFAGSNRQKLFDRYILLAPFLSQDAKTYRPGSGGWAEVGLPRLMAVLAFNKLGITAFNDLTVVSYALDEAVAEQLTPNYSYGLSMNFRPHAGFADDLKAARQPMQVLVGSNDEQFYPEQFAPVLTEAGRDDVPVTIVPGAGHIGLTTTPAGIAAVVRAVVGQ